MRKDSAKCGENMEQLECPYTVGRNEFVQIFWKVFGNLLKLKYATLLSRNLLLGYKQQNVYIQLPKNIYTNNHSRILQNNTK